MKLRELVNLQIAHPLEPVTFLFSFGYYLFALEMEAFDWDCGILGDAPKRISDGFEVNNGVNGSGYGSPLSLVLDRERGELVEAPAKLERKGVSNERSIDALKNHSEAERRRRARINAHLDTLRSVIPGAMKVSLTKWCAF